MRKFKLFATAISVVLALLLSACQPIQPVTESAAAAADEAERLYFSFVAFNQSDTMDGHRIATNGHGTFNPLNMEDVEGGGSFAQVDVVPEGVPKPFVGLGAGIWRIKRGLKFTAHGETYGEITPGVLDVEVELIPDEGEAVEATMRIICNLGFAGMVNMEDGVPLPEGYILSIPDMGTFIPIISEEPGVPPFGLTHIGPVRF